MASLYVIRGKDSGRHYELLGPHTSIGRESTNQIQLHDTEISRQHARIDAEPDGRFVLMDLGSSNGSFVNSKPVSTHVLRSGDRIQLGATLLIFSAVAEPDTAVVRRPKNVDIVAGERNDELSQIRRSIPMSDRSAVAGDLTWNRQEDQSVVRSDWEIMVSVSQAITRTLDIDDLLRQVLDLIFQWVRCDCGCVMLVDDVSGHLTPAYRRNRHSTSDGRRLEISQTILDYVLTRREGVLTSNAQADSRWDAAASIVSLGIREAMCVPMQGRYGVVGAIYVDTSLSPLVAAEQGRSESFTEENLKLLVAIANQAALAIEDTQFYRATVQSERMAAMGQTIANLSHHVKNILQGVRGGSYLIEKGLEAQDLEVARKGWRIVEKNQERISNLVMDMLSFSKERVPELRAGDIRQTIEEVIELMQSRAEETGTRLIWEAPRQFPLARFDAEAIHRAILNVVTNAIDAVEQREAGEVRVELHLHPATQEVEIRVDDNGEGIEPENLERIFSVFESKKGARGTGLGLPVSRKILREHGGDITVSSRVGEGTCFVLRWPGMADLPSDRPTMA